MKIIDLVAKYVNAEEMPKKIKYNDSIFEYNEFEEDYMSEYGENGLLDLVCMFSSFTEDIEIIEEPKKIEKLDVELLGQEDNWLRNPTTEITKQDIELNPYIIDTIRKNTLEFQHRINELIDEINKLKED